MNTLVKTTDIFALKIYEAELKDYANIQTALLNHIASNFTKEPANDYTGRAHPLSAGAVTTIYDKFTYQKEGTTINDPNLKLVFDWITEHGKEYWKILNLSQYLNPYILQLIGTETVRGGFVASHNHNPVPIAGVFYLKAAPTMGNLFLENPLDLILGKSANHSETRIPTTFNYEVEAVSGKLVLFPGWMKHFTKPNTTDDMRISMAVNFGCEGQVYYTEFT